MNSPIVRPKYSVLTIADALRANWHGWHLSRKADGACVRREWNGCAVWGDAMRDGTLQVWDIDRAFGQDVRCLPWDGGRDAALEKLFSNLSPKLNWQRCPTGAGVEFIEAMILAARLDNTPDVIVSKPMNAPFGVELVKVKLLQTFDCIVTEPAGYRQSIGIAFEGQDAGRCPCRNLVALDSLRVGDVVEIAAGALLPSGKFREPRFLRARPDKGGQLE